MKGSTFLLTALPMVVFSAAGIGSLYSSKDNTQRFSNKLVSDDPGTKDENLDELHINEKNVPDLSSAPVTVKLGEPQLPTIVEEITSEGRTWQVSDSVNDEKTCTDWGGSWRKENIEEQSTKHVCYLLLPEKKD